MAISERFSFCFEVCSERRVIPDLNGGEDYFWHDSGGQNRSAPIDPEGDCKQYRDLWDSTTATGAADDPAYFPRYSTFLFAEKAIDVIEQHIASARGFSAALPSVRAVPVIPLDKRDVRREQELPLCGAADAHGYLRL